MVLLKEGHVPRALSAEEAAWEALALQNAFDAVRFITMPCEAKGCAEQADCADCAVRQAYEKKGRVISLRANGAGFSLVNAEYIVVDGCRQVLEMVLRLPDSAVLPLMKQPAAMPQYTDYLTGVYNRWYFEKYFAGRKSLDAVAMLDLDNFKQINDTYMHWVGDHVLRQAAQAIQSGLRDTDTLIRYGGDEFIMVFSAIMPEEFQARLENIRALMTTIREDICPAMTLTASIGGTCHPDRAEAMVRSADMLLYKAKRGKNCVCTDLKAD